METFLEADQTIKNKNLKRFNPTRWVERHTSISMFLELQKSIISALKKISEWDDRTISSLATQFCCEVCNLVNLMLRQES